MVLRNSCIKWEGKEHAVLTTAPNPIAEFKRTERVNPAEAHADW